MIYLWHNIALQSIRHPTRRKDCWWINSGDKILLRNDDDCHTDLQNENKRRLYNNCAQAGCESEMKAIQRAKCRNTLVSIGKTRPLLQILLFTVAVPRCCTFTTCAGLTKDVSIFYTWTHVHVLYWKWSLRHNWKVQVTGNNKFQPIRNHVETRIVLDRLNPLFPVPILRVLFNCVSGFTLKFNES